MASACVNSSAGRAFEWLSACNSLSREPDPNANPKTVSPISDPDLDFIDFEFRIHDSSVAMLPADELFSGGKLVPLQLSKPTPAPATLKLSRREELIGSGSDNFAVSPKAPTCTGRWRELLRMKRQQQTADPKPDPGLKNPNPRTSSALKLLLHRKSSSTDPDLTHPLLRESEPESLPRLSLFTSSTSSDDSDPNTKPNPHPILLNQNPPRPAVRGRNGRRSAPPPVRCSSVDSPRMTASGRVVFQGLGRSSSSPSTFNGGGPAKNRYNGMRVINVPVPSRAGSVFGFLGPANAGSKGRN